MLATPSSLSALWQAVLSTVLSSIGCPFRWAGCAVEVRRQQPRIDDVVERFAERNRKTAGSAIVALPGTVEAAHSVDGHAFSLSISNSNASAATAGTCPFPMALSRSTRWATP